MAQENGQLRPEVLRLTELVESMVKGQLSVPRFQRPYVWDKKDVLELLDSIQRGYPIGSLLFWETDRDIPKLKNLGSLNFHNQHTTPSKYILDGHQRLATLAGCLLPALPELLDKWDICFDLEKAEFRSSNSKTSQNPKYFPLRSLLKTVDFIKQCRSIHNPEWIERAERLADSFKNYKIATVTIIGGDEGQAVEIFSRLNNLGKSITADQMLSALTYKEGRETLAECIDHLQSFLEEEGFGSVHRTVLFRILLCQLEIEPRLGNSKAIETKLNPPNSETLVSLTAVRQEVQKRLVPTINFFREGPGILNSQMLPYGPQLLLIYDFFRSRNARPSDQHLKGLEQWFWQTSFSGWFAGATESTLVEQLRAMRAFSDSDPPDVDVINPREFQAQRIPQKYDNRSARFKTFLALWFYDEPPLTIDAKEVDIGQLARQNSLPHLFSSNEAGRWYSSLANRGFFLQTDTKHFMQLLREDRLGVETLYSQGFSEDVLDSIARKDIERALEHRFRNFIEREKSFLDSLPLKAPTYTPEEP
jgi:hypothetical protein